MKNYNKIIIFDWGGVVESHSKNEYNCFTAKINTINRLAMKQLEERVILKKCNECNYDENGKCISEISTEKEIQEWFNKMKKAFNLQCNYSTFYNVYQEEFDKVEYYKDVVKFTHSLKNKCLIGILSNLVSLDKPRINRHFDLSKFDYVWLSFEMNCKKPNEEIYIMVENDCRIKPENILFIDDTKENIEVAKKRKWNVCHTDGHRLDKIQKSVNTFLEKTN